MSLEFQKRKEKLGRRSHSPVSFSPDGMNYGHVTGQETPYSHGPYGLCGIDVFPEITAFSEQTGQPMLFLGLRAEDWALVYAT